MVVEGGGALVEAACVPRIPEPELLAVEMVAEFVAEGAEERPVGGDLLAHRRPHPHPDQHGVGIVVAEQLRRPVLADFSGRAASTRTAEGGTP